MPIHREATRGVGKDGSIPTCPLASWGIASTGPLGLSQLPWSQGWGQRDKGAHRG
jgi:hypothetical protein